MLIFEGQDEIIYKVGYDEEVFDEQMIRRFKAYFALGMEVLLGEDMTYGQLTKKVK
jgi:hypothetical protein